VTGSVQRVLARVRGAEAASAVFSLLDSIAEAVSAFEVTPEEWRLEAYPRSPLSTPVLTAQAALAAAAAGGALVEIGEEKLSDRDWLAENQLTFPPLRIGRFFVYGSHYRGAVPASAVGIAVDAATAFGTGEHPSTRGCLLAIQRLVRRHRFHRPLDVGTGTGILSIATAKLLNCRMLASDIDAGSISVARHNIARNGVRRLVRARRAAGYADRVLRKSRYDLILSNILARPLALLAADLAQSLAPGGRAVLSGLLSRQEPVVLAPHRSCGLVLEYKLVIDGWSTLVLRRRQNSKMEVGAETPIFGYSPVYDIVRSGFLPPSKIPSVRHQDGRLGRAGQADTLDQGADFRAVNSNIRKRVIVKRHQLGIRPVSPSPLGKRLPDRYKKVHQGHA
jgi:ribosomal protein L11 methyltransferase